MTGQGAQSAIAAHQAADALIPEGHRPLGEEVLQAHYQGNRDEIQRLCLRAEAGLASHGLMKLTDQQLEERVERICVLLAATTREQERRERTRSQKHSAEVRAAYLLSAERARSLDGSEDAP